MKEVLKNKILEVCAYKIEKKGINVGVSFYAFFENKNKDPDLLLEMAIWWIKNHKLDHFEKATKIIGMVKSE
jgi:hypothetical protein